MADDPVAEQTAGSAQGRKPSGRGRGKAADCSSSMLPTSPAGASVARDLKKQLGSLLDQAAQVEATCKRSSTVDTPDYHAAYDHIVGRSKKHSVVEKVTEATQIIGGILVGFSVNYLTGGPEMHLIGWFAMVSGLTLSAVALVLKWQKIR